jgi:predicted ATPase/class 3 adenylate cyclase
VTEPTPLTFLFTDIEGSTRLWDQHPEAMRGALARHDELVWGAIERHHGRGFKTTGDAFCAAFETAADGLVAALAVQRALQEEPMGAETRIRVRIALHSGTADGRDDDYFGPALNRCARLLAVAHGGQTILSRKNRDRLPEELPEEIVLKDLSLHRLRDLSEPEHVFQVLHPELSSEFPPLGSLNSWPNNLPLRPSRFIGRFEESEAVNRFLDERSLLTLTGAGGSGKTRLALQVAADRIDRYRDGVWLVELAPLEDAALVPQAMATVLGVRESPALPLRESLIEHLRPRQALLLLDHCEHLIEAAAAMARDLLRACPDVRILATSREALGIEEELLHLVPPLTLPPAADGVRGPEERLHDLLRSESVRLFVERATETAPGFQLTPENSPAVAEICRRLDGVALAIELAAARVRVLSPEQIAARLDDHLRLLTAGRRGAPPHQQTMRGAIEWSVNLLAEPERALMRRLAVFSGGWTLEMAEAVCADGEIEAWDVLDLLSSLVDKSLVVAEAARAARRYRAADTDDGIAEALEVLAKIAGELGDGPGALALSDECLALRRDLGDSQGVADSLIYLALVHLRLGNDDTADQAPREGLALASPAATRLAAVSVSSIQDLSCARPKRIVSATPSAPAIPQAAAMAYSARALPPKRVTKVLNAMCRRMAVSSPASPISARRRPDGWKRARARAIPATAVVEACIRLVEATRPTASRAGESVS